MIVLGVRGAKEEFLLTPAKVEMSKLPDGDGSVRLQSTSLAWPLIKLARGEERRGEGS